MPTTTEIVQLLDRYDVYGQFRVPNPPWPEVDHGSEDVYLIDWRRLFYDDQPRFPDDMWIDDFLPPSGDEGPGAGKAPDVLAWYQPIHFFGPEWGIYIREDGISSVAARIGNVAGVTMSRLECIRAAIATLFLHEAYHHKIESFSIRLLSARQRPAYPAYFRDVYMRLRGTDDLLEEALANAESWRRLDERVYRLGDIAVVRRYLDDDFRHALPGYRRAGDFLGTHEFRYAQAELLNQVAAGSPVPTQDAADWRAVTRMHQALFELKQNFWTVVPKGTRPGLPIITPRKYETRTLVRALESSGYREIPGTKHRKFAGPSGQRVHLSRQAHQAPHVVKQVADALGRSVYELQ